MMEQDDDGAPFLQPLFSFESGTHTQITLSLLVRHATDYALVSSRRGLLQEISSVLATCFDKPGRLLRELHVYCVRQGAYPCMAGHALSLGSLAQRQEQGLMLN
jgi:hypothetical protein